MTAGTGDYRQSQIAGVNALHPGSLLNTKMVREAFGESWGKPDVGASVEIALATSIEYESISGQFFDQTFQASAHQQAYDEMARLELREITNRLLSEQ